MMKLENLPSDYVKTFIRHINMLNLIGISVFDDDSTNFFKRNRRLIFFGGLLITLLVGQIMFVVWHEHTGASFMEIVNAIPNIFIIIQDFLKLFVSAARRHQIREVIIEIGEVWPTNIADEVKRKALKSWTQRLKTYDDGYFLFYFKSRREFCEVYFGSAILTLSVFELTPLLLTIYSFSSNSNAQYQFPLQIYYFCWLSSHYQYVLAYCYFFLILTIYHLCIYISSEFILVALTFDLSALLNLLQIDLENIAKTSAPDRSHSSTDDDCSDIKAIVITHQKLLRLAARLDEIFGAVIFTQVSFSSVVICCFGFMSVIADGMLAKNVAASMGIMFAIFNLAWPGQLLADTSSGVSEAAYRGHWYERSVKFRKYISIIMARPDATLRFLLVFVVSRVGRDLVCLDRSQNPCYLSALGFSYLTLIMFSKVLSRSWSYLSLLKQMYQDFDI